MANEAVGLLSASPQAAQRWGQQLSQGGLTVRTVKAPEEIFGLHVLVVHAASADEAVQRMPPSAFREHWHTPILVLLDAGNSDDRAAIIEAGADACLTGDVSPRELVLHIARLNSLADLTRQTARHTAAMAREMAHARRVQEHILPMEPPVIEGVEIAAQYVPATDIGGDFFDVVPLGEDRVGFFVADVAGHGIGSALNTMVLKSQLVIWARPGITMTETLGMLNNYLNGLTGADYATAVYVVLDLRTRELEYTVAGHPNPLLWRRSQGVRMLETYTSHADTAGVHVGLPLGMFGDGVYLTETTQLLPGDRVYLYTDGLIEWRSEGGDMLGVEGLRRLIGDSAHQSLADQAAWLVRQAAPSADGSPPDDINLLAFEVR
jgi:sigma-B regulation protein RsbU (phosphoserine phosphatase)